MIFPGGSGINLITDNAVTLFPHPVSPINPKVSPLYISKFVSSNAFTIPS